MTPERARDILVNIAFKTVNYSQDAILPYPDITREEKNIVLKLWGEEKSPTTTVDTLIKIGKGELSCF